MQTRDQVRDRRDTLLALGVAIVALGVYLGTLCRTIAWGDSSDLTAAAYHAGVPHPTGYPTYMLLGHLFLKMFPLGSPAYRMNLFSALAAAAAVAVVYLLALRLIRSRPAAVLAALLFAFSRTFWSQAVIAEVYAFHALLIAATLLSVLQWDRTGSARWLRLTALLYGLSFTHHLTSILLAPALIALAITSPHRAQFVRELKWNLPLFLLPLALYAYLPWAAFRDTPANWGDPRSLQNLLHHVTGWEYREMMGRAAPPVLWDHLLRYGAPTYAGQPSYLFAQWGGLLLLLAPVGMVALGKKSRRLLALTALYYLTVVLYAASYNIPDIDVYYIPSHLIVALWIGLGAHQLAMRARAALRKQLPLPQRRQGAVALAAVLLLLPVLPLAANWSENNQAATRDALEFGRAEMDLLKPNSVVIAGGDIAYLPLLYVQHVEQRRPDITFFSVYDLVFPERLRLTTRLASERFTVNVPECYRNATGMEHKDRCLIDQLVADNIDHRPVYLMMYPKLLKESGWIRGLTEAYYAVRVSNLPVWELRRNPGLGPAQSRLGKMPTLAFGEPGRPQAELLRHQVEPSDRPGWLKLHFDWSLPSPLPMSSREVRLLFTDPDGSYRRTPDGSPAFAHTYHLGQVAGKTRPLPGLFRETLELYVPPSERGRELRVWVGLYHDDRPLPARGENQGYVEVGSLPPVAEVPEP